MKGDGRDSFFLYTSFFRGVVMRFQWDVFPLIDFGIVYEGFGD